MPLCFNLSLHRSGTQSFHKFCLDLGLKSRHFPGKEFDDDCSKFVKSMDFQGLFEHYQDLITDHDVFCDLPVPLIWTKILNTYPDARYVLICRPVDVWLASVRRHTYNRRLDNLEMLQYARLCDRLETHLANFSDAEICHGYEDHACTVSEELGDKLTVLELGDPKIGAKICNLFNIENCPTAFPHIDEASHSHDVHRTT